MLRFRSSRKRPERVRAQYRPWNESPANRGVFAFLGAVCRSNIGPFLAAVCVLACPPALASDLPPGGTERLATLLRPDGSPASREQQWIDRAKLPAPPGVIRVVPERCPYGYDREPACTTNGGPIFLSPAADGFGARQILLHEIGHHVDYAIGESGGYVRGAFLAVLGMKGRGWRSPPNSPHEQFAEAWSLCALSPMALPRRTVWEHGRALLGYEYRPTLRQHRHVCRIIAADAARHGWF